ncbi:hypothetical protein ACIBSV_23420 [Embleya sp. NPDC050154]|uniref:hypothetical protein n=1 Tax=Embleya sp. NPDC050154 TaxID=3363988 RepID=UPI0037AC8C9B
MATTRRPRARKCPDCKGSGQISTTVRVGKGSAARPVGEQEGLCLTCFGSGLARPAKEA